VFAAQPWVDVLGFQPTSCGKDTARTLSRISEAHPIIVFTPHENALEIKMKTRVSADEVRHSAYCGLMMAPPAGVSYAGLSVERWDTTVEPKKDDAFGAGLPVWHKALFMPGAKQLGQMSKLLGSFDFWRLRPEPAVLAAPGNDSNSPQQAYAQATPAKDLSMVYVINDRMLEVALDAIPHSPTVTWFNPRLGSNSPAVAVVAQGKCQFPTPDPGDWVLLLKAGK